MSLTETQMKFPALPCIKAVYTTNPRYSIYPVDDGGTIPLRIIRATDGTESTANEGAADATA